MDDVGILTALVEEYSPSGHEAGAVQRFIDSARSLGFTAHADAAGNSIARIGEGPPSIMFLGHIDTVEGRLPVRFVGDRLHGRGLCDAKGALAAALMAAHRHDGPGEIIVVGAEGEERNSRGVDLDDVQSFIDRNRGAVEYETVDASAAIEVDSRNDVVRALCAGIRKQGSRPTLLRKLGTSDLN